MELYKPRRKIETLKIKERFISDDPDCEANYIENLTGILLHDITKLSLESTLAFPSQDKASLNTIMSLIS
jgi:hypothetical protein